MVPTPKITRKMANILPLSVCGKKSPYPTVERVITVV
jgi:hypothetical protein